MFSPLFSLRFADPTDAVEWAKSNVHGPCVVWMRDWRQTIRLFQYPNDDVDYPIKWDYDCYEPWRSECPKS